MSIMHSRELLEPHDLTFLHDVQYVYHCHHYNLFHDQTIDDIVGEREGERLRTESAQMAFGSLFLRVADATGAQTPAERMAFAQNLFAAAGHGRLMVSADERGGTAEGSHLHYGYGWLQKYGDRVRRQHPADAVASGAAAGAVEAAYRLPLGTLRASEVSCITRRDPSCRFEITGREAGQLRDETVLRSAAAARLGHSISGLWETEIDTITNGLQSFVQGVGGDERGLVEAFGVMVTLHLSDYYNRTAFEAIRALEASRPQALPAGEALLREAGHVCVFNTFGNLLLSPEWEALVGRLSGEPEEIVLGASAIARGLGFGRWAPAEFVPGKRLVMRTASNYEAPYWLERYGVSPRARCYFYQGAVLAIMVLASRVKWAERPQLTQRFYDELFRSGSLGFELQATRCLTRGDDLSEVIVECSPS